MAHWDISRSIAHWAMVKPSAPAIVCGDAEISWEDFDREVDAFAARLVAGGVRFGDRVACLMGNRAEYYFVFFAVARIGAVFVPVNSSFTPPEVAFVVGDAGATALVTESVYREQAAKSSPPGVILDVDDLDDVAPAGARTMADIPRPGFDDMVAILYTSGTTGKPKGATFTHANFYFTAQTLTSSFGFVPEDRHLVNSPLHFTGGLLTLSQAPVLTGGTIVLTTFTTAADTIELIRRHRVTIYLSVPAILTLIAHDPSFSPEAVRTLRVVSAGSAPLPLPLITTYSELGVALGQAYALTEGGGMSTILLPDDVETRIGSAGRSTLYTEVRVVGPDGDAAAPGEVGEIQQRGPTVTAGYWNNDEANAELFAPGGWIRTGDLGTMDEHGYLTVVGRSKDVVIAGGVNVYPAEVESVLSGHPALAEVAVIGLPHEVYGETVTAVVSLRPGMAAPTIEELHDYCADRLAAYKIPRLLHVVDRLPRTASGKVRKIDLRVTR
ncbi:AMP-binding protein [Streptosporangium sp. NPDC051022]|uniref:AMP-binding protein n=1 Tax=Streptosporangium sp. NPDC051022 TaxID=3155752 RepID=UPI00341BF0C1